MRRQIILNQKQAIEIYEHMIQILGSNRAKFSAEFRKRKIRGESSRIASKYGVTAKTIRDIWNRRSWSNATNSLWFRYFGRSDNVGLKYSC
mmetsp:Transcript_26809/g.70411  ORF Transcript_26809/g.70411 Transcript_26809/m.70411 type:complete len:91 (+) Transcript_26809:102-374(+)